MVTSEPRDDVDETQPGEHRFPDWGELPEFAVAVLDVVDSIPPGRVLTYGAIAAIVGGGGPRRVGRVLSTWGSDVCWWRVVRADGRPPQGHEQQALRHYRAEGTALTATGDRIDLRTARWSEPD
jgi:alkylated DNA nucleotide flippase Atl1